MDRFANLETVLAQEERDARIGHVVFAAVKASLRVTGSGAVVVQVDHASQFSWTYDRYNVSQRALQLLERVLGPSLP
jgi:hypothetical protein